MITQRTNGDSIPDFVNDLREARRKRFLSIGELARKAQVGSASITRLENLKGNKKELTELQRRRLGAWPRIIAQLMLVLGEEPERWVSRFAEVAAVPLDPESVQGIVEQARQRLQVRKRPATKEKESRDRDTLTELKLLLKETTTEVKVEAYFLTAGHRDVAMRDFYRNLMTLLLKSIHPRLDLKVCEPAPQATFRELFQGLTEESPRRYRLLVGAWDMVTRSPQFRVQFTPIPFWSHRLACLAHPQSGCRLTWEKVRRRGSRVTVLTLRGEAGDLYMQAYCDRKQSDLVRFEDYDMLRLSEDLKNRQGSPLEDTVAVLAETEATVVADLYYKKTGTRLIDLAARPDAGAPRYPVAIVTADTDERFAATLRRAARELLFNAPALLVEAYAEYLTKAVDETLLHEGCVEPDLSPAQKLERIFFGDNLVPSTLQLVETPEFRPPMEFKRGLRDVLRKRFERFYEENEREEKVTALIRKMVPFLDGPEEKLDRVLRYVCRLARQADLPADPGDSPS